MSTKKGPKPLHWRDEEDHNRLDDVGSRLAVKTPGGPFLEAYFINLYTSYCKHYNVIQSNQLINT